MKPPTVKGRSGKAAKRAPGTGKRVPPPIGVRSGKAKRKPPTVKRRSGKAATSTSNDLTARVLLQASQDIEEETDSDSMPPLEEIDLATGVVIDNDEENPNWYNQLNSVITKIDDRQTTLREDKTDNGDANDMLLNGGGGASDAAPADNVDDRTYITSVLPGEFRNALIRTFPNGVVNQTTTPSVGARGSVDLAITIPTTIPPLLEEAPVVLFSFDWSKGVEITKMSGFSEEASKAVNPVRLELEL